MTHWLRSWFYDDPMIGDLIVPPRAIYTGSDERLPQRAAQRRAHADDKHVEAQRILTGEERPRIFRRQAS